MAITEEILELRLALARSRKLREAKGKYPSVDLSHLTVALEKIDRELERAQDNALAQTRELLLDLMKMADDFDQD